MHEKKLAPPKFADFDIALIGMGIRRAVHMTIEAAMALSRCRCGFVVSLGEEEIEEFRAALISKLPAELSVPPLQTLSEAYQIDRERSRNYAEAGLAVLDAAKAGPVAFLTPGNPVTFDSVTQVILEGARDRGLRSVVVPGVSSVESVLVDLQQEMAPGFQVFEATWMMRAAVPLNPALACLLLQTSVLGTNLPKADADTQIAAWTSLRDYLLKFYPADHMITAVRSGRIENDAHEQCCFQLITMPDILDSIPLGSSLYIPAVT